MAQQQQQQQPDLAQLTDEVQTLRQQLQQLQQANPIGPAPDPQMRPEKTGLHIPKYSGTSKDDFDVFQRQATLTARGNNWTLRQTIVAVLHAMQGDASRITATVSHDPDNYDNEQDFFDTIRLLFVTPAYSAQARAEFEARVQRKDENIRVFHGLLQKIWASGYMAQEEPWRAAAAGAPPAPHQLADPPGYRSNKLMEKFISGLANETLRVKIRDSITMGKDLTTYAEILERTLSFQANLTLNEENTRRVHSGQRHQYKPPAFDIPAQPSRRQDEPEPMEIGNIGNTRQGKEKYCKIHKVNTHRTEDCRVYRKEQQQKQQGNSRNNQAKNTGTTTKPNQGQGKTKSRPCYECGSPNHFKANCPKLKNVHNVDEDNTHHDDISPDLNEEGWGHDPNQGN